MFTECPACNTCFRVTPEQLRAAAGQVRCGHCSKVFNALESLTDDASPETTATPNVSHTQPEITESTAPPPPPPGDTIGSPADEPVIPGAIHDGERMVADTAVSASSGSGLRTFALLLANLLAAIVLVAQAGYHFRSDLVVRYPALQPWLEQLCTQTGCELQPWRDVSQISLHDRDIRSDPELAETLSVNLTLVNNADLAQPFPDLELTFAGLDGAAIAKRRFKPAEYLAHLDPAPTELLPKTPVAIQFKLVDPGDRATSFRFDLK